MITITNNQEGKEKVLLRVTKGSYDTFYKRLGYSIVKEDRKDMGEVFKAIPISNKKYEDTTDNLENISIEDTLVEKKVNNNKKKTISNE